MRPFRVCIGASLVVTAAASAAAQAPPKPREFTADVGFVSTTGNTEVTTFNLGEKLILRAGRWEHREQLGSIYGSQDGRQTSNLVFGNVRSDFALTGSLAVFGFVGYDRNTFAGISRRFEEALGLAVKLLTRESDRWTMEAGLAMNQQRAVDGTSTDFASVRSGTAYRHNFTSAAYVQQSLEFLPNLETSDDYRLNSETALVAPLSTHVSMKLGYVVRYDNLPEPGKVSSDRIFTSGLQFNW